ncbi:MAG: hypothetical protein JWM88_3400 [Verrucomicrobia bacterium]|nr:hypothetical protein [Verrucomicrobiota bacterium]
MDESPPTRLAPPPRPSKTPSWVLLGFVIGVLFVWALPREIKQSAPLAPPPRTVVLQRPKATDIEAVFSEWGRHAVWEHDLTEVALWDVELKAYSLYYEILRSGDVYYFRSIPKLTRPILTHGVTLRNCPLMFTETQEMRKEWLSRDRTAIAPPEDAGLKTTSGDGE